MRHLSFLFHLRQLSSAGGQPIISLNLRSRKRDMPYQLPFAAQLRNKWYKIDTVCALFNRTFWAMVQGRKVLFEDWGQILRTFLRVSTCVWENNQSLHANAPHQKKSLVSSSCFVSLSSTPNFFIMMFLAEAVDCSLSAFHWFAFLSPFLFCAVRRLLRDLLFWQMSVLIMALVMHKSLLDGVCVLHNLLTNCNWLK